MTAANAETGFGMVLGAGLIWSVKENGLRAEARGQGLLTHADNGFRELGFAGSLAWQPGPERGRGPKLILRQTLGASASGGMNSLLERETLTGLAANSNSRGAALDNGRLQVRLGYGFAALANRYTITPEFGFSLSGTHREYSAGWRMARDGPGVLDLLLEAVRREAANDNGRAEHDIGLRLNARW